MSLYAKEMAEKITRNILNAYNRRKSPNDLAAVHAIAEKAVLEVIGDCKTHTATALDGLPTMKLGS